MHLATRIVYYILSVHIFKNTLVSLNFYQLTFFDTILKLIGAYILLKK